MRWVTAHQKGLLIHEKMDEEADEIAQERSTGFEESITGRAVHELLFEPTAGNVFPLFPALLAARAVVTAGDATSDVTSRAPSKSQHRLAWVDSTGTFYPPAALGSGISPAQLCVLRPHPADLVWATIESLRCRSIKAVVALMTQPLTRVEVRRLQLAAELGGGAAVLIRPNLASAASHIYAAATRWLVTPAPGERTIQRWHLQLVHGHGRQIGQSFLLEKHRASDNRTFKNRIVAHTNIAAKHLVHLPAALGHHAPIQAAS